LEEALTRLDDLAEPADTVALARMGLGIAALSQGDPVRAAGLAAQTRAYCRAHGDKSYLSAALVGSALIALAQGDPAGADGYIRECLPLQLALGDSFGMANALDIAVTIAAAGSDYQRAVRLLGAAHRVRQVVGRFVYAYDFGHRIAVERAREALSGAVFETAFTEGADLTVDQAVSYALHQDQQAAPAPADRSGPLTRREREVAELIAQGLTNQQIATRLVVSRRTAESHVENIMRKLGFTTRTQVAAWLAEQRHLS
jgi:DNA-binding CsgD family transcriptional regulator